MTDAEKKIEADKAAAKVVEDAKIAADKLAAEEAAKAAIDPIIAKDEEIAKLKKERDNYKTVALKRLGKLEGDAGFMEVDKDSGLTVEEQVKKTLLDREIARIEQEKEADSKKLAKENAELRLALKNRPSNIPAGGDSGNGGAEVRDNVFSAEQIETLKKKALALKADPEKFVENAKKNFLARR